MSGLENVSFKASISRLKSLENKLVDLRNHYKREDVKYRSDKIDYANECLEAVKNNLNEANMFKSLCELFRNMEIKLDMFSSQIKTLTNENNWLQEELKEARERLHKTEMQLIDERMSAQHLEFVDFDKTPIVSANSTALKVVSTEPTYTRDTAEVSRAENKQIISEPAAPHDIKNMAKTNSNIKLYKFGTLKTLDDIVSKYSCEKRYELAIHLCKEAIEELKQSSTYRSDMAYVYVLLSTAYQKQGNFNDAKESLYECLKLREAVYGDEHSIIASTYNNLSVLYGKSKKFMQAEILCRRALAIRQKVCGESHPDVAKQLVNLAVLSQNQAKWAEAEACFTKALDIYVSTLTTDDPNISKIKSQLAVVLIKARKYVEAEVMIKEMIVEAFNDMKEISKSHISSTEEPESSLDQTILDTSRTTQEYGDWHKSASITAPTLIQHMKNLVLLYKKSGNIEKTHEVNQITKDLNKINSISELKRIIERLGVQM